MKSIELLSKMIIKMLSQYDNSLEEFFDSLDQDDMHELLEDLQDVVYDWSGGYDGNSV